MLLPALNTKYLRLTLTCNEENLLTAVTRACKEILLLTDSLHLIKRLYQLLKRDTFTYGFLTPDKKTLSTVKKEVLSLTNVTKAVYLQDVSKISSRISDFVT